MSFKFYVEAVHKSGETMKFTYRRVFHYEEDMHEEMNKVWQHIYQGLSRPGGFVILGQNRILKLDDFSCFSVNQHKKVLDE